MRARVSRFELVAWAIVVALVWVGCCSNPKGPETNVSVADYRATISQCQSNLVLCDAALRRIQTELPTVRPAAWWEAQLGVLSDTAMLCSDVLNGSLPRRKP